MVRGHVVRFWKRMIAEPFNIPIADVQKMIGTTITQEEYDAIAGD